MSHNQYIIEFIHVGSHLKVVAIDPVTGREVSMIGAPEVPQEELMRLAAQKLEYVLAKERGDK